MLLVAEKQREFRVNHFFKIKRCYYILVLTEAADYLGELNAY